jgi:hypothetical protein
MRFLGEKRRKKVRYGNKRYGIRCLRCGVKLKEEAGGELSGCGEGYCSVSSRRETLHVSDDGTVANMGHPAFGLACFGTYDSVCPPGFCGSCKGYAASGEEVVTPPTLTTMRLSRTWGTCAKRKFTAMGRQRISGFALADRGKPPKAANSP